jgi:molybdenum cofactor biosynthesis enzyme MoaA/predicted dehydrogenase
VHGGGRCDLRCALCDCAAPASPPEEVERALEGGGARVVVRGPTERSATIGDLVARARQQGFAEIVLRTNAVACATPANAAAFARLGADAVLVPLFSDDPTVHDRIAGRRRALLDALAGMRNLARAGLGVEIEVPILSPSLQRLDALVELVHRAVPSLRAARFFVPPRVATATLAPPSWSDGGPALARALLLCRRLRITARLGGAEGVPLCALREYPDLYDAYAFNPKARSAQRADASFAEVCESCAVRAQCAGVVPAYAAAHGEAGLAAYAQRPALMYEQRTTRRRAWTPEQRAAASRAEILVLRPTVNCNQDCTFCSANETSTNVWASREEMLRAIARTARRGIERVSFSGGEPTLSKHLVEYVHCAARLGVRKIELVTNAVLLDKREKVAALTAAGLTHAFVSLHAHDEALSRQSTQKIGDFERTVRGIKHLVDAGVETALNHVISARNYPYLTPFVEFVRREFGGRVNISFAFVTPQFKALDNIEVMPRLTLVMPHLKRALYRALELGQSFTIGSRQGIPFCFLDEFRAWSDGLKISNAALAEDAPQKQRGPMCDECRFSNHCTGLWRPYVAQYGFGELRPVAGTPLTAAERASLHLFSKPLPWGSPQSFEELPASIREPALELGPPQVAAPAAAVTDFVVQRSRPLRVALLGSGRQARRLARDARGVAGISIDAVASPHAPQADVRDFGDCPAYDDAAAALDDIRPEAVIVAAATAVHDELARLAIERGIPVLLEKPVTSTEDEALALCARAAEANVCVVPAHNSLHAAGLGDVLALPFARPAVNYVWRRTQGSSDTLRTWSRSALYESLYHVLAIVGAAAGSGAGDVAGVSFRGDGAPASLRLDLRYGAAAAEVVLDFAAAAEEDVLVRRDLDRSDSEHVWHRQGRAVSIANSVGVRAIAAQGNDIECMLANFRDVVLGKAEPVTTLAAALAVMQTARRVIDALAAAGAPFEHPNAPRHVASRILQAGLGLPARSADPQS